MKDEYVSKEAVLKYIRKAAETAYGDCKDAIGDAFNHLADDLEMHIIRPSIVKPPEGEYISKKKAVDALCFDYAYAAADIVNKMPGIDAAPVVHAHWQPYKDTVQCSACGFGTVMDGYFFDHGECIHAADRSFRFNFCPNCGAKMDKQEGE